MWRMRSTVVGEARFMRFLVVARQLAAREGVMAVSFDSLARASGTPKTTLQSYFGTAAELRSGTVEHWCDSVHRFVFGPAAQKLCLKRVWSAIHCWLVLHHETAAPLDLLRDGPQGAKAHEWSVLRSRVVSLLREWDRFLTEAMSDASTCGQLVAETSSVELVDQLVALTTDVGVRAALVGAEAGTARAAESAWAVLARAAIRPEAALPPREDAVRSVVSDANERVRVAQREFQESGDSLAGARGDALS